MTKYHINKHGVPAICKAKNGKCPLGGEESHFSSQEEAQEYADKQNEKDHGLLPGMSNENKVNLENYEEKDLMSKVVTITTKDGEEVEGIVSKVNYDSNSITLKDAKDPRETQEVNLENSENMEVSKHHYFSEQYKKELREKNKALPKFRFTKNDLEELEGSYVMIDYDGKEYDGEIIGTNYESNGESGLIIRNGNEEKYVKNYQLQDLEETGKSANDHNNYKKMIEVENNIIQDSENYDYEEVEKPSTSEVDPEDQIKRYFDARIRQHSGEEVNLKEYEHDWVSEVEDNQNAYRDSSKHYSDFNKGGGQYDEWSLDSEHAYEDDLDKASETNDYFEDKKEKIENMIDKVKTVDWTKYGKSQKDGEIDALKFLADGESVFS